MREPGEMSERSPPSRPVTPARPRSPRCQSVGVWQAAGMGASALQDSGPGPDSAGCGQLGWWEKDPGREWSWQTWHWLAGCGTESQSSHEYTQNFLRGTGKGGREKPLSPRHTSGPSGPSFSCIFRAHSMNTGLCWHPPRRPLTLCGEHTPSSPGSPTTCHRTPGPGHAPD